MIIEIALGIVLGVILLRLLPIIFTLGIFLAAVLLVLGVAGFLIHWAWGNEDAVALLAIALTFGLGFFVSNQIEEKSPLNRDEARALTIFVVASGFTAFAIASELLSNTDVGDGSSFLPLAILLSIFGIYLVVKITTRIRRASANQNDQPA